MSSSTRSSEPFLDPLLVLNKGLRLEQLSGESELLPGLFVVPTPCHTPSHQSVLVKGEDALSVIAGQAVYSAAEFAGAAPATGGELDGEAYARSLAYLRGLAPEGVYFSHDAFVWTKEA